MHHMIRRYASYLLFFCGFLLLNTEPVNGQDVLTLSDALEQARENNYELQISQNELQLFVNDVSIGNAGFLPRLTASGDRNTSITTTEQEFIGQEPERTPNAETTQQAARATLSWRAFDGLGRFATWRRLQSERDAQQQRTRSVTQDVLTEVTIAYLTIVREQQTVEALKESVEISEERLRLTELRNRLGTASDLEVRQARVDLNADRAQLLRQESSLSVARSQLNRLLGAPEMGPYEVEAEIPLDTNLDQDLLLADARQNNPRLQSLVHARESAGEERREIRAERLPSVDLQMSYEYSDQTSESGFVRFSESYGLSYGVSVTLNLFDGLNRRRRAQNAQVRERNAELAFREIEAELVTRITEEFTTFRNRIQLVELEESNVEDARANANLALRQFELGAITSLELREVQEALIQAETRLLESRFEARSSEAELRRLAGDIHL